MSTAAAGFIDRFKAQLAAEKKKACVLGVLFLVFLAVLVRAFVTGGPTPAPANANDLIVPPPVHAPAPPPAQAPPAQAPQRIRATPVQSAGRASRDRTSAPARTPAADPLLTQTVSVEGRPRTFARDIFNLSDWSAFASDGAAPAAEQAVEDPKAKELVDELTRKIEEMKRLEALETEETRKSIEHLQLQSTLIGPIRSAYISGRLVHEGDTIDGFEVLHIRERTVTLRKGDVLHKLVWQ